MNTMSVHDLHSNEDFLAFVGHDINSIGNVQAAYHGELENPLVVDMLKLCMMMNLSPKCIWKTKASMETTLSYFIHMGFYEGK
jgi:hypothetical protein